jgi:hypothetical protein
LVSPFVLMAILNNLGHLHTLLRNEEQAARCYGQLQSTGMYMLQITGKRRRHHHRRHTHRRHHHSRRRDPHHGEDHRQDMIRQFLENASVGLQADRMTAAAA